VKICVAPVKALRKKEREDETQFSTKIGGKTSFMGPSYFVFVKSSFPVNKCLMPYYAGTGHSRPLIA
jgi:hypothetical protein